MHTPSKQDWTMPPQKRKKRVGWPTLVVMIRRNEHPNSEKGTPIAPRNHQKQTCAGRKRSKYTVHNKI